MEKRRALSEHTWGAYNSVSEPDKQSVKDQWHYNRLTPSMPTGITRPVKTSNRRAGTVRKMPSTFLIPLRGHARFSYPSKETKGDAVTDENGQVVPSQRLSSVSWFFLRVKFHLSVQNVLSSDQALLRQAKHRQNGRHFPPGI